MPNRKTTWTCSKCGVRIAMVIGIMDDAAKKAYDALLDIHEKHCKPKENIKESKDG